MTIVFVLPSAGHGNTTIRNRILWLLAQNSDTVNSEIPPGTNGQTNSGKLQWNTRPKSDRLTGLDRSLGNNAREAPLPWITNGRYWLRGNPSAHEQQPAGSIQKITIVHDHIIPLEGWKGKWTNYKLFFLVKLAYCEDVWICFLSSFQLLLHLDNPFPDHRNSKSWLSGLFPVSYITVPGEA